MMVPRPRDKVLGRKGTMKLPYKCSYSVEFKVATFLKFPKRV